MTNSRSRRKQLTAPQVNVLDVASQEVERLKDPQYSKQPRFAGANPQKVYFDILSWVNTAGQDEPPYLSDSRARDAWLRAIWPKEPHLAGVINSVVSIDKNRGWSLIGGRNQVNAYTAILHSYEAAPGLSGWRAGVSAASQSYHTADLNTIVEIGRDGPDGPMRKLYHVDPARCKLTNQPNNPLNYYPPGDKAQSWAIGDFFRVASLNSTNEMYNGLGLCSVSRCLELAKIMLAVYQHDQEQLGARAPRGLLLLNNIGQDQWEQSLASRDIENDSLERRYYGGVQVLCAEGGLGEIKAQLLALSNLPLNFNLETFTNLLMYGYALVFGYDPREFWPVSGGSLGTATETETQHRKATGKGGQDFMLAYQEQIQDELPAALQFEFDQRDDDGELLAEAVKKAQIDTLMAMYTQAPPLSSDGAISLMEVRQLLAEQGLIPRDWTLADEETESTDIETARTRYERLLDLPRVRRACETFKDEPIIEYRWPLNKSRRIWDSGAEAFARRSFPSLPARPHRRANQSDPSKIILYADPKGQFEITQADVNTAINEGRKRVGDEYADLLTAKVAG
jgi:hypothetical protein